MHQGYDGSGQLTQTGHTLHCIVSDSVMHFSVPCDISAACNKGLDALIQLSNHGTILAGDTYFLYIPSSPVLSLYSVSGDISMAQRLRLDAAKVCLGASGSSDAPG
jgi:hypothetical protein